MINANNLEYLKQLTLKNIDKYENYICFSNVTDKSDFNTYDYFCIFGKDLSFMNHNYTNATLKCSLDTNNWSSNNYNNNLEKVICTSGTFNNSISIYDTVYTNLDNYYPNFIFEYESNLNKNIAYNIDTNYTTLILLLLVLPIIINFIHHFFFIGGKQ